MTKPKRLLVIEFDENEPDYNKLLHSLSITGGRRYIYGNAYEVTEEFLEVFAVKTPNVNILIEEDIDFDDYSERVSRVYMLVDGHIREGTDMQIRCREAREIRRYNHDIDKHITALTQQVWDEFGIEPKIDWLAS